MRGLFTIILSLLFILFSFIVGIGVGLIISREDGFPIGERIAILEIQGVILDSQPYLDSLSKIKKDDGIKAIVLRIDSPGGAVGPSQEIYSEILKLREKKPVIATLGSVGASGGYYIACAAQKILANPGTITGSIGVIAQFVSYEQLLKWAKLDVEVIKSGEFKDVGSPFKKMTETEKQYMQQLIDNVYSQFKLAVSKARGIDSKEMDKIADGRIFTGEQAKNLKLIDELGTLSDAISLAGTLSGIKGEPNVSYYPKKKMNFLDFILSKFETEIISGLPLKERFGLFYLVDM
ncbi:MAG: signal peptide peptidase SppA, 67K type, protease IV [Candidatus Dadabacteria bacterium CSP1-2]|nr:MAG: signal peptide peptidase SppA, 67K type, protease IV [Candidatus Dadabacteria bacterium CSP1-2]